VFQPHRYSRTQALLEEFGCSFGPAERVFVTDVYAAGETPIAGIDGEQVADALRRHGHGAVTYEPDMTKIPDLLRETLRAGDIVLTLGAGDVWKVGEELLSSAPESVTPRADRSPNTSSHEQEEDCGGDPGGPEKPPREGWKSVERNRDVTAS